jgi:TniQ protein
LAFRPLPRSLSPLANESLPGYILRLAHRLDRAPGRIALLTGLSRPLLPGRDTPRVPAVRMLHLDTATAATFAHATRLSTSEIARLCLDRLRTRYPPLDLDYEVITVRHKQASGISGLARWVFTRSTRYCPQCLAGDGSSIQQAHGGAWQQLWRLPPVFFCIAHERLLAHRCPSCCEPVQSHRGNTALLPRPQDASLHPAQCRTTIGAGHWRALSACGARLDLPALSTAPAHQADPWLARLLVGQRKLVDLLRPDGPAHAVSAGHSATPAQYFLDLRLLVGLLRLAWPEARELSEPRALADAVDNDPDEQRQQGGPRQQGRRWPESVAYSAPPLNAGVCGSLLALADQLLAVDDPLIARERLQPLIAAAITSGNGRHLLKAQAPCSDGLRAAIAPELQLMSRTRRTGRKPGDYRPPSRRCRFGPEHVPQYLPDDWFDRHFRDLAGINPRLVRRFAPIRLVQMTAGGSRDTAAALLGIPSGRHQPASFTVMRWTQKAANGRRFNAALEALACELDVAGNPVDYRHRREVLQAWSIPQVDWHELVAELSRRESPRDRARIDWGDHKRRIASVLVWMRVTQGEHLFAPLVMNTSHTPVGRNLLSRSVQQACRHIRSGRPGSHYVALDSALDAYADVLTAHIDNRHRPSSPRRPTSPRAMTEAQAATSRE